MKRKQRSKPSNESIAFARDQRKQANEFARTLWQLLRNRQCCGMKFRREYPVPPYTADFCCVELKLIVEVDGGHHFTESGVKHDKRRDQFLADLGYEVLRIPGYEILRDGFGVRERIEEAIRQLT